MEKIITFGDKIVEQELLLEPHKSKISNWKYCIEKHLELLTRENRTITDELLEKLFVIYPDYYFEITNYQNICLRVKERHDNNDGVYHPYSDLITITNNGIILHYPISNKVDTLYHYLSKNDLLVYEILENDLIKSFVSNIIGRYKSFFPMKEKLSSLMITRTEKIKEVKDILKEYVMECLRKDEEIVLDIPMKNIGINSSNPHIYKLHLDTNGKSMGLLTITYKEYGMGEMLTLTLGGKKKKITILDWIDTYLYSRFNKD
jgi:hypothetical protein